jgi:hypothetical protein
MKSKLLDRVLEQIAKDVKWGDMTAIEELIADIPDNKAMHFLPEEEWSNFTTSKPKQTPIHKEN